MDGFGVESHKVEPATFVVCTDPKQTARHRYELFFARSELLGGGCGATERKRSFLSLFWLLLLVIWLVEFLFWFLV